MGVPTAKGGVVKHMRTTLTMLLLVGALSSPSSAATAPVACKMLDVLEIPARRPVVLCVSKRDETVIIALSTDGGRAFSSRSPLGLPPEGVDYIADALLSPTYSTDRAIYLRYRQTGLWKSTDGGANFAPIDFQGGAGGVELMSRLPDFKLAGQASPSIALGSSQPAVLVSDRHIPVAGSENQEDRLFLQAGRGPSSRVLLASWQPLLTEPAAQIVVSACDALLSCTTQRVTLTKNARLIGMAAEPSAAGNTVVVATHGPSYVWSSRDGGRTFSPQAALGKLLRDIEVRNRASTKISVPAILPGGRHWIIALTTASENFFLHTYDAGAHWRAVPTAFINSLPVLRSDSRGFVYASGGFQCSSDAGRTWRLRCP